MQDFTEKQLELKKTLEEKLDPILEEGKKYYEIVYEIKMAQVKGAMVFLI